MISVLLWVIRQPLNNFVSVPISETVFLPNNSSCFACMLSLFYHFLLGLVSHLLRVIFFVRGHYAPSKLLCLGFEQFFFF